MSLDSHKHPPRYIILKECSSEKAVPMLILMSSGEIWSARWVLDGPALAAALMTSLFSDV